MAAGQAETQFSSVTDTITMEHVKEEICSGGVPSKGVTEWIIRNREELKNSSCSQTGRTLLHLAAANGNFEITNVILRNAPDLNCLLKVKDNEKQTPLQIAVYQNRTKIIEAILSNGRVDIRECVMQATQYGTSLHQACRLGYSGMVRALLNHQNKDLLKDQIKNKQTPSSYTPLHQASLKGHTKIIKILFEAGSTVDLLPEHLMKLENKDKDMPIHLAVIGGNIETVKFMIKKYPGCINLKSDVSGKPFWTACKKGRDDIAEYLAECGASVTEPHKRKKDEDKESKTPMMIACEMGQTKIVKFLADRVDIKPIHLYWAIQGRSEETVSWLILHHGKGGKTFEGLLRFSDDNGKTPFMNLIKHMPNVAEYVLDKCIENVKEIPKFQHEFIEGYEHEGDKWKPEELTTDKNAIPLSTMVKYKRGNLLTHPVVTSYIHQKLKKFCPFYLLLWLLFVVYLFFITVLAITLSPPSNNTTQLRNVSVFNSSTCTNVALDAVHIFLATLTLFYITISLLWKIVEIVARSWYTGKQSEFNKEINPLTKSLYFIKHVIYIIDILEIIFYIAAVVYSIAVITVKSINQCPAQWVSQLGAVVIFFSWLKLLIISTPFKFIGVYSLMILQIIKSFLKVLLVFVILLTTFGLSLHISLPDTGTKKFGNALGQGIVDLLSKFTGQGFENLVSPPVTFVLFLIFIIVMVILFSNLLIGLAVGDVQNIYSNAVLETILIQVNLILDWETTLRLFYKTCLYKKKLKVDQERDPGHPDEIRYKTHWSPKTSPWDQVTSSLIVLLFGGESFNSRKSHKEVSSRYNKFRISTNYIYENEMKIATQPDINELRDFIEKKLDNQSKTHNRSSSV